jgi:hypothetical protein
VAVAAPLAVLYWPVPLHPVALVDESAVVALVKLCALQLAAESTTYWTRAYNVRSL